MKHEVPLALQRSTGSATIGITCALLAVPALLLAGRWLHVAEAAPAPAALHAPSSLPPSLPATGSAQHFDPEDVVALARRLAAMPPRQPASVTPGLESLSYDQYRDIRFRIDHALWNDANLPFRLDVLPAGFVYKAPVRISVVENGVAREITSTPGMFDMGAMVPAALHGQSLSLSGFRLRTHLNSRNLWDEFLVFQGASYFRAVARGQRYGLSARGLAIGTGEPQGEEFPSFTQFWIEKPKPRATSVVIHALLESASVTGAYRFIVTPGQETNMDVQFTLFPRVDLANVGVAPLTSMFLFDGSNHQRFDDFRHRVHDSDGLLFVSKNGEQVWRHLANPRNLQFSSFTSERPLAFGLMQRARKLSEFQDFEANYELRPSAWVRFGGGTPPGPLRLVEIPTPNETNDNIVAFWQPQGVLPAGRPYSASYRLSWTSEGLLPQPLGRFTATRSGMNFKGDRRLMVLDVTGAGTSPDGLTFDVEASAGKVEHPVVQSNPVVDGLRATFEFDPGSAPLIEFRAVLRKDGKPVSETWLYRWTAG